jgi:hypothetical protein
MHDFLADRLAPLGVPEGDVGVEAGRDRALLSPKRPAQSSNQLVAARNAFAAKSTTARTAGRMPRRDVKTRWRMPSATPH